MWVDSKETIHFFLMIISSKELVIDKDKFCQFSVFYENEFDSLGNLKKI